MAFQDSAASTTEVDLRLCRICSDVAPEGDTHHPHYGGICCFSCRAFFRRVHQRGPNSKKYVCKKDGKCTIYPKSKQLCKRCRLDKCLQIGMNPKWVLSAEEKKVRFKHYFKKKEEIAMGLRPADSGTPKKKSRKRSSSAITSPASDVSPEPLSPKLKTLPQSPSTSSQMDPGQNFVNEEMKPEKEVFFKVLNRQSLSETRIPDLLQISDMTRALVFSKPRVCATQSSLSNNSSTSVVSRSSCLSLKWFAPVDDVEERCNQLTPVSYLNSLTRSNQELSYTQALSRNVILSASLEQKSGTISQIRKTFIIDRSHSHLSEISHFSAIMDAFTMISTKVNPSSDIGKTIIMNHQRLKCLTKRTIISQMSSIAAMVAEFAVSLSHFSSLVQKDQNILLQNNIPLYLQYVLARYFSSDSGLEQVNWILEGQISIIPIDHVILLKRISFKEYNDIAKFFVDPAVASAYGHCAEAIGMFYPYAQHCNAVIANMLLFNLDPSFEKDLHEPDLVRVIFNDAKEIVRLASTSMDSSLQESILPKSVGPLINSLKKMNRMFEICQVDEASGSLFPMEPSVKEISFTTVEESWIKRQLFEFQDQFRSVGLPESYYNDMIRLWAHRQQVSDTFVRSWICLSRERARRVLKIHPDFTNLSDKEQDFFWSKNCGPALALHCVRINMQTKGKEQLRSALGVMDSNKDWEEEFKDIMDLDNIQAHYLQEQNIHKGKLDDAAIECFSSMMQEVSEWCSRDELFQIFFLIVLLDAEGMDRNPSFNGLIQMRTIYLKFFQRKLESVGLSFVAYSRFRKILRKIRVFSQLMEVFFD